MHMDAKGCENLIVRVGGSKREDTVSQHQLWNDKGMSEGGSKNKKGKPMFDV
jgi:hypothetical protein